MGDADHADPLLDTVGPGFVVGLKMIYVVVDLPRLKGAEVDLGDLVEKDGLGLVTNADGGDDLVGLAGEGLEHGHGLGAVGGFAEKLALEGNDGVSGDDNVGFGEVGAGLALEGG